MHYDESPARLQLAPYLGPRVVLMMSATAFAAEMFPSCAARPVSLLVLTGRTITGALMVEPGSAAKRRGYFWSAWCRWSSRP